MDISPKSMTFYDTLALFVQLCINTNVFLKSLDKSIWRGLALSMSNTFNICLSVR